MALVVRRIDATKGRGLFALRAFQQGEIVLAQPPLAFWRKPQSSHACAVCLTRSIQSVSGCSTCSACSTECSSQYQKLWRDVWCECQFSDKTPRFALMAARLMLDSFVHSSRPTPPRPRPARPAPAAKPISTTPNDIFHISDDACFELEPATKLWWASQLCFAKLSAFETGADDGGIGDVHRRFIAVMANKLNSTPEQMSAQFPISTYLRLCGAMHLNSFTVFDAVSAPALPFDSAIDASFAKLFTVHSQDRDSFLAHLSRSLPHSVFKGRFPSSLVNQWLSSPATPVASALFPVASFLNHSCVPNVVLASPLMDGRGVFVAARDIAPNEELNVSYIDGNQAVADRQEQLKFAYGFECQCSKCTTL